jgi:SPP1 gp7 family putative phage head morphogenesis protein
LRAIFNDRKVPAELQQKLIDFYYKKLGKGIDIGYKKALEFYDEALAESLKANILEFSAFKEASFRAALVEVITDSNKLPTWAEFKAKALQVSDIYNVNYLKTEYHQTVATANMAGKYKDYQKTKELYPNLKYATVGDKRVRDKHKKWDGFIAPINDPIWKNLLPPNDWGCRCDVIPSDEAITNLKEAPKVKTKFANNAAISGKVFKKSTYELTLNETLKKEALENITKYKA